jgi:hypothetical protein
VENGWPIAFDTTNSEVSDSSMAASVLADAELPRIAIIAISASPTIRALAVAAVRRGLRREFSVASRPTVPKGRNSTPKAWITGRPASGDSSAAPTRIDSIPSPICHRKFPPSSISPDVMAAAPPATSTAPAASRTRSDDSGIATSSRSAWIGGIREARRAGRYAARTVTVMPTAYAATTVLGWIGKSAPARSRPKRPNNARSPRASRYPPPSPSVEPIRPTPTASRRTERFTCPREAPSARSRASSRLRWATRMEKVLMMMNEPTTRDTAAKTSRKVLRKPRICSMPSLVVSTTSSPVRASTPSGSTRCAASASRAWLTPSAALSEMLL